MLKISDKTRTILIFLMVFIVFYFICYYFIEILPLLRPVSTTRICFPHDDIDISHEICVGLKFLIGFFIHYLPTVLFLKYIFKKVTNTKKQMWLVAFALPLTNLVYVILNFIPVPVYHNLIYEFYFYTIGVTSFHFGVLLNCFLPSVILTAWLFPKKYLPAKTEIWKTALLTILISISPFLLFIITLLIINFLLH